LVQDYFAGKSGHEGGRRFIGVEGVRGIAVLVTGSLTNPITNYMEEGRSESHWCS
jgi:hypothetical protein